MRWIVDAMNVIGCRPDGWWRDRRKATVRLVADLEAWATGHGDPVTVVLEGPTSPPIRSEVVDVAHAPAASANSADDEIVRRVLADPESDRVTVITSDRALLARVEAAGARSQSASGFRDLIDPRPPRRGR